MVKFNSYYEQYIPLRHLEHLGTLRNYLLILSILSALVVKFNSYYEQQIPLRHLEHFDTLKDYLVLLSVLSALVVKYLFLLEQHHLIIMKNKFLILYLRIILTVSK